MTSQILVWLFASLAELSGRTRTSGSTMLVEKPIGRQCIYAVSHWSPKWGTRPTGCSPSGFSSKHSFREPHFKEFGLSLARFIERIKEVASEEDAAKATGMMEDRQQQRHRVFGERPRANRRERGVSILGSQLVCY